MKECNICANHNCDLIKSGQGKMRSRHQVPTSAMRISCKKYIKASSMRVTIFENLLTKQSGDVLALLNSMDMRFAETRRAPFFTFAYN